MNFVTIKDAFPVPDVIDALDSLRGAKYFATIDLLSGYWQHQARALPVHQDALRPIQRNSLILSAHADHSTRYSVRLLHLLSRRHHSLRRDTRAVDGNSVTRLKEKGLKAKPSKSVLFRSPIDFLGHMVSADGIQPQPDKLAAIRDWPTPHCLRDVRAFYGLGSYYRKFVKDFAKIAEPLSRMTKKNTLFTWTDETQQSIEDLKRALLDVDTLAYPTPGTPCILDTDASDVAVGAVLSPMVDGVEKPIAYFSRVFNGTQINYCPTRRELLAVITYLQHFGHYLLGNSHSSNRSSQSQVAPDFQTT